MFQNILSIKLFCFPLTVFWLKKKKIQPSDTLTWQRWCCPQGALLPSVRGDTLGPSVPPLPPHAPRIGCTHQKGVNGSRAWVGREEGRSWESCPGSRICLDFQMVLKSFTAPLTLQGEPLFFLQPLGLGLIPSSTAVAPPIRPTSFLAYFWRNAISCAFAEGNQKVLHHPMLVQMYCSWSSRQFFCFAKSPCS